MRRFLVLVAPLAAALSAGPALAADENPTIVVTGKPLKQTADELAACLARNCPPDEDIKATLAHAENQFVSGDYKSARGTLLRSVSRNRRHGQDYAVPVSDLLRANARVAAHLGESEDFQSSTIASRDVLRSRYGNEDLRTLSGDIEVADMRAKLGFPDEALRIYDGVSKRARAKNLPYVAAITDLRSALLMLASDVLADKKDGRARLEKMAAYADPSLASVRLAAKVALARLDRGKGDESATRALLAEYAARGGTDKPQLISAEPIKLPDPSGRANSSGDSFAKSATLDFDGQWFDVGFWVTPEGRTGDIEVIRKKGSEAQWVKPVLASIASRIYAPMKREPGDPGVYMVERYTLTSRWEERLGTRFRERSPIPRIERLDLTAEQATEPETKGS